MLMKIGCFKLEAQFKFVPLQPKKSNNKPPWLKESIQKEIKKKVNYLIYRKTNSF